MIKNRVVFLTTIVGWALGVGTGFGILVHYQITPAKGMSVSHRFPNKASFSYSREKFTLVQFIHPHCPCTSSSVENLGWILARSDNELDTHVLVYKPSEEDDRWIQTDIYRKLKSIPNAQLHIDSNGFETTRFGAKTSGEVALYNSQGQLIFQGGITAGRGHAGSSAGRDAILSLLKNNPAIDNTSVFGCSII